MLLAMIYPNGEQGRGKIWLREKPEKLWGFPAICCGIRALRNV
jgi:hypothetical protein